MGCSVDIEYQPSNKPFIIIAVPTISRMHSKIKIL